MPAAMPDAGSTVALVHADPALGAAVALHTGAALVKDVLELPRDVHGPLDEGGAVPWRIENAYYVADVGVRFYKHGEAAPAQVPAVLLLVASDSPLAEHRERLRHLAESGIAGDALEIALVVGVQRPLDADDPAREKPPTAEVEEMYTMEGWEYLELGDEEADEEPHVRIRDALMAHMWPGLELRGSGLGTESARAEAGAEAGRAGGAADPSADLLARISRMEASLPERRDAEMTIPPAPASMQQDLEAFLSGEDGWPTPRGEAPSHGFDDEFDEFVEAPGASAGAGAGASVGARVGTSAPSATAVRSRLASQDDSPFPIVFDTLQREVERVRSMEPGEAKERAAASVALAVDELLRE